MDKNCTNNVPDSLITRLRAFLESEARSCSMDPGCITSLYVYRVWGGAVAIGDIEKAFASINAER